MKTEVRGRCMPGQSRAWKFNSRPKRFLRYLSLNRNLLDTALGHVYVHEMFDALTLPAWLLTPQGDRCAHRPRPRRVGAALHGVVAGRLRAGIRSGQPSPRMPTGQLAHAARARDSAPHADRRPDRTTIRVHRSGVSRLTAGTRIFQTRRSRTAIRNAGLVLEQLAGAIAGMMSRRTACRTRGTCFSR